MLLEERVEEKMWQFIGFFGELGLYLLGLVNAKFSDKMKLEYPTQSAYFQKRAEIEKELILNGVNWYSYFENCEFLKEPTREDAEFVKTLSNGDLLDMLVVVGKGLRGFVDAYEEEDVHCEMLHDFYLLLKREIKLRPNLNYIPTGDGFLDYLESREARKEIENKKLNARIKGNLCIFCESENVRSNGNMWKCLDCNRQFRKSKNLKGR